VSLEIQEDRMFENLLPSATSARRKRIRNAIIGGSVVAHGLVAVGLIVIGMWKIEKLETERSTISVSVATPAGDSGGGARPKQTLEAKERVKRVVDETVQPEKPPTEPVVETKVTVEVRGNGEGGEAGRVPGNGTGGDGKGLGVPTIGSGCLAPPCGTSTDIPPPELPTEEIPPPKEPKDIPPTAAKRISGDPNIAAPDGVKAEMLHLGTSSVQGNVKLCIDEHGVVQSASTGKSTGYKAYDKKLRDEMRTWRYKPYTENGEPTPACFVVHLKYVIKD
jgi:TonB family protein